VDDLRAALGSRVKGLREERGWSQAQLAERADLDLTYISGIERGRRNPGLNSLGRLAKALNVALGSLLTDLRATRAVPVKRGRPPKRHRPHT
jgi:transcriptional regulator with XRE-family HTH domain